MGGFGRKMQWIRLDRTKSHRFVLAEGPMLGAPSEKAGKLVDMDVSGADMT